MNNTMMNTFLKALNVQGHAALLAGEAGLLLLLQQLVAQLAVTPQRLAGGILVHWLGPVVQPVVAVHRNRCEAVPPHGGEAVGGHHVHDEFPQEVEEGLSLLLHLAP